MTLPLIVLTIGLSNRRSNLVSNRRNNAIMNDADKAFTAASQSEFVFPFST